MIDLAITMKLTKASYSEKKQDYNLISCSNVIKIQDIKRDFTIIHFRDIGLTEIRDTLKGVDMVQHSDMMEDSSSIDFEDTGKVESQHMNATKRPKRWEISNIFKEVNTFYT